MKTMKKIHMGVGYLALFAFIAISALLYIFVPHGIANIADLNWIALLIVLGIVVTPLGSKQLKTLQEISTKKKKRKKEQRETLTKQSFKSWLAKIFLLQISIGLIYYGTAMMTGVILPISKHTHPDAFMHGLNQVLLHNGLFPWALVAMLGVSFGLIAYRRNEDSYFNNVITAPFKALHHNYGIIIDNIGRSVVYSAIAFSLVIACLGLATLVAGPQAMQSITGFKAGAIGGVILMCVLTFRQSTNPTLAMIHSEKPNLGMLVNLIIWGVLLGVAALVIFHVSANKQTALSTSILTPILNNGWNLHWDILTAGLFFCFTPLLAIYVARYSYGYSLRALILATLILPFIIALLLGLNQHFHVITHLPYNARIAEGAAVIGVVILLYLVLQKKTASLTNILYLAKPGPIKPRSTQQFIGRIKRFTGVLFYLFIPASIFITSLFLILGIVTFTLVVILSFISLFSIIYQDRKTGSQ